MQQEIQSKLDEIGKNIALVQEVDSRTKKDKEQVEKMNSDVCKAMEDLQELKIKQKLIAEQNDKLEKLICNGCNTTTKSAKNDNEIKAKLEFSNYIRKRTAISKETVDFIAKSYIDSKFPHVSEEGRHQIHKDMTIGVDPDGGYYVRPEILNLVATRIFETSPVRQYASVLTTGSKSVIIGINDEAIEAEWIGETESTPITPTPKIGTLEIFAHKLKIKPSLSRDLVDDAVVDIEAELQRQMIDGFSRAENTAFVVGSGAKKPRGFLEYPAWTTPGTYERGRLEQLVSSVSGSLEGDDIKYIKDSLIETYQANARWYMKRNSFTFVTTLKTGTGAYLLDPNSFKRGDTDILVGSEVIFMHDMPEIAANSLAIAYGDLARTYQVVDRFGIRVLRDPYTVEEMIIYRTTKRVGGAVKQFDSFKILKIKP